MAGRIQGMIKVCRFCLCKTRLIPLSKVLNSAFTIDDVVRFTGIKLSEKGKLSYAICCQCFQGIEKSVTFRRNCLVADVSFKQLLSVLSERINSMYDTSKAPARDVPILVDSDIQRPAEASQREESMWNDNDILPMDSNGVADSNGQGMEKGPEDKLIVHSDTQNVKSPTKVSQEVLNKSVETRFGKTPESDTPIVIDSDSQDSTEGPQITTILFHEVNDEMSMADSDSDYSVRSLYSELMEKEAKNDWSTPATEDIPVTPQCNNKANIDGKKPIPEKQLCPYCGLLSGELVTHINRAHIKNRRYACPSCPKTFYERFLLKEHINTRHEKRIIITCEKCGKGFTNSTYYWYHMANAHGKSKVYECEICHRVLKSYDGHRKHLKEHSLTCHSCPDCGKRFKTLLTLDKHQQRYHSS